MDVLNRCNSRVLTEVEFDELNKTGWSLDAWLQVAMNLLIESKCPEPFSRYYDLLEQSLYGHLLAKADVLNQRTALIAALNVPRSVAKKDVLGLVNFFESQFGNSSLMALAKWLERISECPEAPRSVLTFNADGLLDTLLMLLGTQQHIVAKKPGMPPSRFYRSLRASQPPKTVSKKIPRRIPIHHIHGCLVPQNADDAKSPGRESRENLIFPETTYGRMSGKVYTWQQTMFLSHAQAHRIVFVGLSMSDPNIRRWLAWCNETAVEEHEWRKQNFVKSASKEQRSSGSNDYFIGQNIWIHQRPKSIHLQEIMEFSLAHLGTRICWLDNWSDLSPVLSNLFAT